MLTYDDISSKTNKFIIPRLVDNVYKSSPVLTRLRTKNMERFEGGQTIRHPIMYAELKGGAFTRGGTFDISYVQTDTALEFNVNLASSGSNTREQILSDCLGPCDGNKAEAARHRDRLSERTSRLGRCDSRGLRELNRKRSAEMTDPCRKASNNFRKYYYVSATLYGTDNVQLN